MTNLEKLSAETTGMDFTERSIFDDYLIGALSVLVNEKNWNAAIMSAQTLMARRRAYLAMNPDKAVQS